MHAAHMSSVRAWLRSDPSAADVPWLGDSMTPLMWNGPLGAKITIAVVGDGFAAQDQDTYNKAVDNLLTNGLFAQDFYLANKLAFNLLRINLVSVDSGVSTKTYDTAGNVVAQTNRNTALGAYFNGDWAHCWVEDGPTTAGWLSLALSIWVPDHRLVLVLLNNPGFGGCGGGGRATLPLGVTWSTIAHEFGHALGGLADEYHDRNQTYTGGEPGAPNATINTNRTTLKWASPVRATTPVPTGGDDYTPPKPAGWNDNQDVGLFEGGSGRYQLGIYRPVVNCRMKSNTPPFCPVCNTAMSAQTAPHLAPVPSAVARRVETETAMAESGDDSYVRLLVRMEQGNMRVVDAREIAGPLVQPDTVAHGLAHELLIGGRRVAIGSLPDAAVSRSFSEIGPEGPREHHIYPLDTYEFVIRVSRSELRGTELARMTVNVVSVQANRGETLNDIPMQNDPALDVSPIASTNLAETAMPISLRRIIESK
jgi:hypothetical protein